MCNSTMPNLFSLMLLKLVHKLFFPAVNMHDQMGDTHNEIQELEFK